MDRLTRKGLFLVGGMVSGVLLMLPFEFAQLHSDITAQTAAIQKLDADMGAIAWQNGLVKNQGALGVKGELVP